MIANEICGFDEFTLVRITILFFNVRLIAAIIRENY